MIGQTLGSYRLLDKLGEGGMGVVYKAEHVLIGRKAALKLLSRELSSNEQMVTRFFNEARATSMIEHPGLVDVSDFGYHDGRAFIVMEYLQGETLAGRIHRDRRLALDVILSVVRQIAAALAAAHAKGIIHRDLKPDNVFLLADREVASGLRVKVLDFGIAKLMDEAGSSQAHTHTGTVLGTPRYMSPEQCRGTGNVDYRADIYSLGCMMFEMALGVPPFDRQGTGELIAAHIYEQPPRPSQMDPSIPPPLEQLILWCLAKDPNARPRSMAEVEASLEGWAPRMTGGHRPPTPPPGGYGAGWPTPVPSHGGYTPPPHVPSHGGYTPPPHAPSHAGYAPSHGGHTPLPYAPTYAGTSGPGQTHGAPTTLGGAASQSIAPPAPGGRGKLIAIVAGAALVIGAAVVIAIGAGGGRAAGAGVAAGDGTVTPPAAPAEAPAPAPPPAEPPAPTETAPALAAPAAEVTVRITSDPPGADVYRAFDGIRVGQTPLEQKLPRMEADAVLVLRRRGYRDARVEIRLNADASREIKLERSSSSSGGTIALPTPAAQPSGNAAPPTLVVTAPKPAAPATTGPAPTPVAPAITKPAPPEARPPPPPPPPRAKVVVPTAMTKVAGKNPSIPRGASGDVAAKLCVDEAGRVTSVNILRAASEVRDSVTAGLKQWRYKPYVEGGRAIPVCFAVNMKLQ